MQSSIRCSVLASAVCLVIGGAVVLAQPATMPTSLPPVAPPRVVSAVAFEAAPLPLGAVRLTGGPLKHAQDLDAEYLLRLEPDRMVAAMRKLAGLKPKAEQYGGWDGDGRQLTGHIAGHYLSAVSLMYRATGDERFKQRADYLVSELKAVQDARGDGYIGALMGNGRKQDGATEPPLIDGELLFDEIAAGDIRSGGFDLNGMWSPWYVQHKIYAGLRDAYRFTGNQAALEVEAKFAAWAESIVGKLSDEQTQRMLATEFGAMNEVFVDLYADTGDKRWLTLAEKFRHKAIVDPLANGKDILAGKHGNTQVPKLLGHLVEHIVTGSPSDGAAARFFWDSVVDHHSFATGGHGYDEYFGPPDKLSGQVDGSGQRSKSLRTAETCNVYNMLKYARLLFALDPQIKYADFHERALFNHILASMDPKNGRTSYMVPVGPGVVHEYQRMFDDFTCCVGTGMESHALHADGLYYTAGDRLYVNQYAPSVVQWTDAGATLTTETDFPLGDTVTIKVDLKEPKELTLTLRRPAWAGDGFAVAVNGVAVVDLGKPDTFLDLRRTWKTGDEVRLTLPKTLHTEPLADNPNRVALMWGPLVLAGDSGKQEGDDQGENARRFRTAFPVFADAGKPLDAWLRPVANQPGHFTAQLATGETVNLAPFYTLHNRRYSLYWDVLTPEQWASRKASQDARQSRERVIADATVVYFQPGEMQPERDFSVRFADGSEAVRDHDQPGRRGGAWLAMELWTDPDETNAVLLTTDLPKDAKPAFDLYIGEKKIDAPTTFVESGTGLTNVVFRVPKELTAEKKRAPFRLQARDGGALPGIFGVRVLRADAAEPALKADSKHPA